jgi:hypothetical protein
LRCEPGGKLSIAGARLRGLSAPLSGNGSLLHSMPFFPVAFYESCFFGFPAMVIFLDGLFASSFRLAPSHDLERLDARPVWNAGKVSPILRML